MVEDNVTVDRSKMVIPDVKEGTVEPRMKNMGLRMVTLLEPRKNDVPIRRRRGCGRKGLVVETKKQGTIKEYFNNLEIPKDCTNLNFDLPNMELRKRKVEDYGMVEHHDGSKLKKSRLVTTNPERLQSKLTIPDGDVRNLGAKSFCGREPEDDHVLGALGTSKLAGIKNDESGRLPGDFGKVEEIL